MSVVSVKHCSKQCRKIQIEPKECERKNRSERRGLLVGCGV